MDVDGWMTWAAAPGLVELVDGRLGRQGRLVFRVGRS